MWTIVTLWLCIVFVSSHVITATAVGNSPPPLNGYLPLILLLKYFPAEAAAPNWPHPAARRESGRADRHGR
jgi:hypothetical protein